MSRIITRRRVLLAGAAAVGGGLALRHGPDEMPPTYGNLLRAGDNLTYWVHRTFLPRHALAREYDAADITHFPATGTTDPRELEGDPGQLYRRLEHGAFADFRLEVDGLVERPTAFSLADLQALPRRTQVTRHTCEEGWTAIGQWTGVPLARVPRGDHPW